MSHHLLNSPTPTERRWCSVDTTSLGFLRTFGMCSVGQKGRRRANGRPVTNATLTPLTLTSGRIMFIMILFTLFFPFPCMIFYYTDIFPPIVL
ncbi:hypothetical protein JB92DRAFT_1215347 [Gautieria morchelliformis]|nr:hypothetical protein JB92DRAFT_1215347 [Gautieria morchelliformis]